ncbi:MAG TPA: hypothetical protein VN753_04420 [Terracidiphilus sp.]|jgi:hypothetical protein|nr:hypothetical protein [Terracidiphilus sp.]
MIIRSECLTEGLFGEALTWILEILPYLEAEGLKPEWEILHPNYGTPPSYNIFPSILRTTYTPVPEPSRVVSFERLKIEKGFNFCGDFREASRYWNSYFRFSEDVYQRVDRFFAEHARDHSVVGVHYRGTDKISDSEQTNPITRDQFLCTLEDFLAHVTPATTIFVATDDSNFIDDLHSFVRGRWLVRHHEQVRSRDDNPLFRGHGAARNTEIANFAVLDCLTLSRCQGVLTTMSALSAFAKVLNPEVDVYRAACCRPDWFPVAYTKRYRGHDKAVRSMLARVQRGDFDSTLIEKVVAFPNRLRRRLARGLRG